MHARNTLTYIISPETVTPVISKKLRQKVCNIHDGYAVPPVTQNWPKQKNLETLVFRIAGQMEPE